MKIIKISLFTFVLGFVFMLNSCSSWLDLNPYDKKSDKEAITTLPEVRMALNGVLSMLRDVPLYGREAVAVGDAGTSDVVLKIPNSNRYTNVYSWRNIQPDGAFFSDIFFAGYKAINAVNKIIVNLDKITVGKEDEARKNQLMGEAYFFRALLHFEILKYFSQAYNFTPDGSHQGQMYLMEPTDENNHPRETVAKTFQYVIADAEKAASLMTAERDPNTPYYGNSNAAKALLARVYLYKACINGKEDFTKAKEWAEKVINSKKYSLATADEYKVTSDTLSTKPVVVAFRSNMWNPKKGYCSESIFALPTSETERNYTDALSKIYLDEDKGYGDLLASEEIVKLIGKEKDDVRNSLFYRSDKGKYNCVRKFFGKDENNWDLYTFNVFRISEMYLIAAEGAMKGTTVDEAAAKKYLNEIRTNRGLKAVENLTGEPLTAEIMKQRRIELCFEGHRLADVKRLNIGVVRGDDPNNINNKDESLKYPDYRFAYPIPDSELKVNKDPLFKQNPGYSQK